MEKILLLVCIMYVFQQHQEHDAVTVASWCPSLSRCNMYTLCIGAMQSTAVHSETLTGQSPKRASERMLQSFL
jgi:hypothetical protein